MQSRESQPDRKEVLLRAFAEHLRPHLEDVRKRLPDKTHPVQRALVGAYVALLDNYIAKGEEILKGPHGIEQKDMETCKAAQHEIEKLKGWIFPQRKFRDSDAGEFLVRTGLSYLRTTEILAGARKSGVGAPHSAAKRTIDAFEMKISDPSLTWSALADKTCDCGALKHRKSCAEKVRKNVANLEKLLARYPDHWPPTR
jgi:hypothetical protein